LPRGGILFAGGGEEGRAAHPSLIFLRDSLGYPRGTLPPTGAQAIDPENAPLPSGLLPYCYRSQPQHAGAPHDSARRSLWHPASPQNNRYVHLQPPPPPGARRPHKQG
jgi:hypothetical protein